MDEHAHSPFPLPPPGDSNTPRSNTEDSEKDDDSSGNVSRSSSVGELPTLTPRPPDLSKSKDGIYHQPPHLPLINVLLDSNKTHDDEDESRGYVMQVYSFLILINSTDLSSFGDFDSSDDDDEPKIKLNVVIKPIDPNALVNAANIHSPPLL